MRGPCWCQWGRLRCPARLAFCLSDEKRDPVFENVASELVARLQATSYALSVGEDLQEIADQVYEMNAAGASEKQINRRIRKWMSENGMSYETWLEEVCQEFTDVPALDHFDLHKVWLAYGIEPWLRECVRSIAFTDEPIPFFPFALGFWIEDDTQDPPMLIGVMTPLTDPQLAARQLVEKHRMLYGKRASGSARKDEVFNARMLARHRAGMSYKDIAIQNLREAHPDIVGRPDRYGTELRRERERVAKAVRAAQELWKQRGLDSSIDD